MAVKRSQIEAVVVGIFFRRRNVHLNSAPTPCFLIVVSRWRKYHPWSAAIYLTYRTSIVGNSDYSPGVNSRFEQFYDTRFRDVRVAVPVNNLLTVARVLDKV